MAESAAASVEVRRASTIRHSPTILHPSIHATPFTLFCAPSPDFTCITPSHAVTNAPLLPARPSHSQPRQPRQPRQPNARLHSPQPTLTWCCNPSPSFTCVDLRLAARSVPNTAHQATDPLRLHLTSPPTPLSTQPCFLPSNSNLHPSPSANKHTLFLQPCQQWRSLRPPMKLLRA